MPTAARRSGSPPLGKLYVWQLPESDMFGKSITRFGQLTSHESVIHSIVNIFVRCQCLDESPCNRSTFRPSCGPWSFSYSHRGSETI
jgi:hypothetical protein